MASGGFIKKATTGDALRIPADAYNDFIDASQAEKNRNPKGDQPRQSRPSLPPGQIWVRGDVISSRFGVVGLQRVETTRDQDEDTFENNTVWRIGTPVVGIHDEKFVILDEPIERGAFISRAIVQGITPVQINISDVDHTHGAVETNTSARLNQLRSTATATIARILWKPPNLTGLQWCVVAMGSVGGGGGETFAIVLEQTGGSNGTSSTAATWTYRIKRGGVIIASGVNPLFAPHVWKRSLGRINPANAGLAVETSSGALSIHWINEIYEHSTCLT